MRAKTKGRDRDVGRASPRHYEAKPPRATLLSATSGERAAEALAGFARGGRVITLSLGQWDKSDWAEAMAALIGPGKVERVTISTWTAKPKHAPRIARLCEDVRWLLDPTMAQREADVVSAILDQFGEERVALLANHAKFITMRGDGWYLSSTTSSNLSMNPRTEYYDLTDDRALYEFFDRFFRDCQRWGEDADGAEYKALAAAKTESIEKRAARMGVKTMAELAAACGARPMAELACG